MWGGGGGGAFQIINLERTYPHNGVLKWRCLSITSIINYSINDIPDMEIFRHSIPWFFKFHLSTQPKNHRIFFYLCFRYCKFLQLIYIYFFSFFSFFTHSYSIYHSTDVMHYSTWALYTHPLSKDIHNWCLWSQHGLTNQLGEWSYLLQE